MDPELANAQDVDPIEERFGKKLSARPIRFVPDPNQISQMLHCLCCRRAGLLTSTRRCLLSIEAGHRGIQRACITVPSIAGLKHGRRVVAVAEEPGSRSRNVGVQA